MSPSSEIQRDTCRRFGASYLGCDAHMKVGISRNFDQRQLPIHGLRHPPAGDTSGWYIWSGEYSDNPSFFVPVHAVHMRERCPTIIKYLGLGPGWRFLSAPGHEDVWFDASLLNV